MSRHHIETIAPEEKISPSLGGTGYVGPKQPASMLELYVNATASIEQFSNLGTAVWKVLQSSVNWTQAAQFRRLKIDGRTVPCEVIGSDRQWWFVAVDAAKAAAILRP